MVDSPTTTTYCTVDDVRRILSSVISFADDDAVTNEDVRKFIRSAETRINKITRHSWKEVIVTDEYYDLPSRALMDRAGFVPIFLNHRKVRPIATASGDKVEVWDGSTWLDWAGVGSGKVYSRSGDFWLNGADGILYVKKSVVGDERDAVRVTYRYGESAVPEDIRDASAQLAASAIIMNDDRTMLMSESSQNMQMSAGAKSRLLEERALKALADYTEVYAV